MDNYHKDATEVSASGIKEAWKSSRHFIKYQKSKGQDDEFKSHMDFGNAFELYLNDQIHGTNLFAENVIVFERPNPDADYRNAENRKAKADVIEFATANNKYLILDTDTEGMDMIKTMYRAVERNKHAMDILQFCGYQREVHWKDHGANIKTRTDYDCEVLNVLIDVKTCRDASPHIFARDAAALNYPLQAITQMRGMLADGWEKVNAYYWLAVEKSDVGQAVLYEFQPDDWQTTEDMYTFTIVHRVLPAMEALEEGRDDEIVGYQEQSDNEEGTMTLNLPLYYGR